MVTLFALFFPRYFYTGNYFSVGGYDARNTLTSVEKYDALTDAFSSQVAAPMPTVRHCFGAVSIDDGKIVLIGGEAKDGKPTALMER